jgi:hypothetical protein
MGVMFDDETMARLIGTSIDDLYRLKGELLNAGIPSVEDSTGIWFSRRMVKENAKAEKCAEAGKKGGGNPSLASHPNTDKKIPDTRYHISINVPFKGDLYTSVFDAFWKWYPRKVGKPNAEKAMKKALKSSDGEKLLKGLDAHLKAWEQIDKSFIPHPATWLNREGWNDEPPKPKEEKKGRVIWLQCSKRCSFWDGSALWCTKHVKDEPKTCDHCKFFN